jgi:hypothetical protein
MEHPGFPAFFWSVAWKTGKEAALLLAVKFQPSCCNAIDIVNGKFMVRVFPADVDIA